MRSHIIYHTIPLLSLLLALLSGCESFERAGETKPVQPLTVTIAVQTKIPSFEKSNGAIIELTNVDEKVHYRQPLTGKETTITGVIPGIYSITISGEMKDASGHTAYPNGSLQNQPILEDGSRIELEVLNGRLSPLVFKEIYYCGSPKSYFRDQFYEIYNNSSETCYLDGIYFACLHPLKATTKLPVWPAEDGEKYVYSDRLWKFPGSGKDYPLEPGESCVVAQFAANHQQKQYNPQSPIDGSSADFEFNTGNKKFPDQPAVDMLHVFYDGKSAMGRLPQYLTSIFGSAYVIFRVPEGVTYDPVGDKSLQAKDLSKKKNRLYAKIPVEYILDGVEAGDNETMLNAKRMPGFIDAGMTYIGKTYAGLSVVRKTKSKRGDGTPILQDTNNSTEDFERGVVPVLRRDGAKIPAWSHAHK